jgi:hypothetical protein
MQNDLCMPADIKRLRPITLLAFLFLGLSAAAFTVDRTARPSLFERITQVEGAKMTLELDMALLTENRRDQDYHPAQLTVEDQGKTYPAEVRLRGKFRRRYGEMPPLKIKFKKKALLAEGLDTLNEMKLVLPMTDNPDGDDLLLREYVAYRMYEQLSPYALRARLIQLTIRDTKNPRQKAKMYAILLEDTEELCKRLGAEEVERFGTAPAELDEDQAGLVAMFEYLIGNTDWDIAMLRNVKMLQVRGVDKLVLVPFDFDFSGLVNAPYARPYSESGLRHVRDRFLMAGGIPSEALNRAVEHLRQHKDDLFAATMNKHIDRSSTSDMMAFLNTFYKKVEKDGFVPVMLKF